MQSFIILGKDKEKINKEAEMLYQNEEVSKFDIYEFEGEKAIGIADVRNINAKVFLRPAHGNKKAVIVKAFLGMTIDSQNAFLKTLEEPPDSTIIIIEAFENLFLPTILSRCKLIQTDREIRLQKEDREVIEKMLTIL
jgi:DNA polymerase-3 subunit delta'